MTTPADDDGSDEERLNDPKAVDAAFDAIVANIDSRGSTDSTQPWPDAENEGPEPPQHPDEAPPVAPRTPRADWSGWEDVRPVELEPPDAEDDDAGSEDDDEHYVPPPPPPVPRADRALRWAWAGAVGAPAVAILLPLLGWQLDGLIGLLLVAAFLGGFITLVSRLRQGPRVDDGPDDGAVV